MVGDVHAPWCNEAYTTIQLPASASRKGTASLHLKVDTGAGGNMLPLHVFWHLYPDQISPAGLPTGLDHVSTRLIAYNGCHIPLYALHGPITWQPDCPGTRPHGVNLYWYVADTPGPAILGLPSNEKTGSYKDELCHHSQTTWHTSCTCFHYSSHNQACYGPWSSQVIQVHWWLDKGSSQISSRALADSLVNTRSDSVMMPIPWYMPPGNAPSPYIQRSRTTSTRWNA